MTTCIELFYDRDFETALAVEVDTSAELMANDKSVRYVERDGDVFTEYYDGPQGPLPEIIVVQWRELPSGEIVRVGAYIKRTG